MASIEAQLKDGERTTRLSITKSYEWMRTVRSISEIPRHLRKRMELIRKRSEKRCVYCGELLPYYLDNPQYCSDLGNNISAHLNTQESCWDRLLLKAYDHEGPIFPVTAPLHKILRGGLLWISQWEPWSEQFDAALKAFPKTPEDCRKWERLFEFVDEASWLSRIPSPMTHIFFELLFQQYFIPKAYVAAGWRLPVPRTLQQPLKRLAYLHAQVAVDTLPVIWNSIGAYEKALDYYSYAAKAEFLHLDATTPNEPSPVEPGELKNAYRSDSPT